MAAKDCNFILEELRMETECSICSETYVDPRILHCYHTFCLKCLQLNATTLDKEPGETMPCPICRQEFEIPKEGLLCLQKNFLMERLISKLHNIVPVGSQINDELQEKVIPKFCEDHRKEYLIHCNDCQEVVCPLCFVEKHPQHKGIDVRKLLDNFDMKIKDQVSILKEILIESEKKKEMDEKEMEQSDEKILLTCDKFAERADEIKKIFDSHVKSIREELTLVKLKSFKEITAQDEELNEHIASLKSYLDYCSNISSLVSSKEISETLHNINDAVSQLKQQHEFQMSRKIQCLDTEMEVRVLVNGRNIIGQIEIIKTAEGKNDPLAEDDSSVRIDPGTNEEEHDDSFAIPPDSSKECSASSDIPPFSKDKEEENEQDVELTRNESPATAEQNTDESLNSPSETSDHYCESPTLIRTIRTRESKIAHRMVTGITVLDGRLYIVHENDPFLVTYDAKSLELEGEIYVNLDNPTDLVSCQQNHCFYILDKFLDDCHRILRVNRVGAIIHKWQIGTERSSGTLSVSDSGNVIVAYKEKNVVKRYSPAGALHCEFNLCSTLSVDGCHHAIEISSNSVIICFSDADDDYGICKTDTYIGKKQCHTYSGIDMPLYLVEDKNNVLVADGELGQVLVYSSDLEYKRVLLTARNNLRCPVKMCLDASLGRLFVVDCFYDLRTEVLRDSRIVAFYIRDHNL